MASDSFAQNSSPPLADSGFPLMEPGEGGTLIVLTAPLTEVIDHAGYFIQMSMASLPIWLEGILNKKYPQMARPGIQRGRLGPLHAGRRAGGGSAPCCATIPRQDIAVLATRAILSNSSAPNTRVVAVSTHNPLGRDLCRRRLYFDLRIVPAADQLALHPAAVRRPSKAIHMRDQFQGHRGRLRRLADHPDRLLRGTRRGLRGGRAGEVRRDPRDFPQSASGRAAAPRRSTSGHPQGPRRSHLPRQAHDLRRGRDDHGLRPPLPVLPARPEPAARPPEGQDPQGCRANVREGNKQISLATEDMFIWGQVQTDTPFYFPNREALLDLFRDVVETPGVEQHILSHCTIAPAVVDPLLIEKMSDLMLDKSPIHLPLLSTHPKKKALTPLIGLETGSTRMAKMIMPGKGVPFPIEDWPSVVVQGLDGAEPEQLVPGHDADDRQSRRDRRRHEGHARPASTKWSAAACSPSSFLRSSRRCTTRGWRPASGVTETRATDAAAVAADDEVLEDEPAAGAGELVGAHGVARRRRRALAPSAAKAERPELHVAPADVRSALPERLMARMGKIYVPKPLAIKSRKELPGDYQAAALAPSEGRQRRYSVGGGGGRNGREDRDASRPSRLTCVSGGSGANCELRQIRWPSLYRSIQLSITRPEPLAGSRPASPGARPACLF